MIELVIGTYGFLCWLLFKRFKLIPVNTYTVVTAIMGGVVILAVLYIMLTMFHPASTDGRLYAYTTPIVPEVRGQVTAVPVRPNTLLQQGDILFQIDPTPYIFAVERLEAALAGANSNVAQLEERLQAAGAVVEQAKAQLEAAESEMDRQAQQDLEQARAAASQATTQQEFAKKELDRNKEMLASGIISPQQLDVFQQRFDSADAQLRAAAAAVRQAEERLGSGSDRIRAAREEVNQAEAKEREVRAALQADVGGLTPEVRQIMADLEEKRWELEQTTVRAPAAGFATQILLRPGQMAVPLPLAPVMVFVHADRPELVASFPQNVIANFHPGLEAEVSFKAYPGKIFKAKLRNVALITPEGQVLPTGQIRTVAGAKMPTRIPVVFDYGEDIDALKLPLGAQATVAVYTERVHAISLVRKILLRIKSWEHYLFAP